MRAELTLETRRTLVLERSSQWSLQRMLYWSLGDYGDRLHSGDPGVLPSPPGERHTRADGSSGTGSGSQGVSSQGGAATALSAAPAAGASALSALAWAQLGAHTDEEAASSTDAATDASDSDGSSPRASTSPFKFFTFSRLFFDDKDRVRTKPAQYDKQGNQTRPPLIIYEGGTMRLCIASALDEFMSRLPDGLFCADELRLSDNVVHPVDFRLLPAPALAPDPPRPLTIQTLSAITARSRVPASDGRGRVQRHHAPADRKFGVQVVSNLIKKARRIHGDEGLPPQSQMEKAYVRPLDDRSTTLRHEYYGSTHIRAHSGIYEVLLPEPLLSVAYDCGLGERSSMGFGMITPTRGRKRPRRAPNAGSGQGPPSGPHPQGGRDERAGERRKGV